VRDVSRGGRGRVFGEGAGGALGGGKGGGASTSGRVVGVAVRQESAAARVAAAAALDELYAALPPRERTGPGGEVTVSVSHPRDIRDATTELACAYSIVGDSDAIRDLMERAAGVGMALPSLRIMPLQPLASSSPSTSLVSYRTRAYSRHPPRWPGHAFRFVRAL